MNGKRSKLIRSICKSRGEYQAAKRYYIDVARRAAQNPKVERQRYQQPMAVATKPVRVHHLRHAVRFCIAMGISANVAIRNAIPGEYRRLLNVRHTSLDRLFSAMSRTVIEKTIRNLESVNV
ncbi:MAG: hypothetical protein Q7U48_13605 [Hydrogenophaga sp.]|nr:hypothetical protein [Hydrogenophaga sp.]